MKILFIATNPFFILRGTPLRTRMFLEGYLERGHEVDLLTYPVGDDLDAPGLRIFRVKAPWYGRTAAGPSIGKIIVDLLVLLQARRLFRARSYDLVHCEDSEAAVVGAILKRTCGAKVAASFHNRLSDNLAVHGWPLVEPLGRALEGILYRGADYIFTNHPRHAEFIRERYGIDGVEAVYDAVDGGEADPGIALPEGYLAYAGSSVPYQGLPLLLEAFARLAPRFPALSLVLIGKMDPSVGEEIERRGLSKRVLLTGPLESAKTNYLLARARCNVIPSLLTRPVPHMKAIQYLGAGAPIVASDVPCNRMFFDDGRNALLVPPDGPALAEGVGRVLGDDNLVKSLRRGMAGSIPAQDVGGLLHRIASAVAAEGERPR